MRTTSRREFLWELGVSTAALACAPASCLRAAPLGLPIGLQVYTLRDLCETDLEGTLAKVAATGYRAVEMYPPFFGRRIPEVRRMLDANGLVCPSAHWTVETSPLAWDEQVASARELGLQYFISGFPLSQPATLDDYKRGAEILNKAGEQCRAAGFGMAYHNHHFEFQTFDGVVAYDELLRRTDPKLVSMQMDCFWVTFAGKEPVDYFQKFPGRFALLHIKDLKPGFTPSVEKVVGQPFAEVGRGVIDWHKIFAAAPQAGVKHYFVEQDRCDRPPLESIRISFEYLKNLKV
jgi:sugar phosphate isomerase/epimerase